MPLKLEFLRINTRIDGRNTEKNASLVYLLVNKWMLAFYRSTSSVKYDRDDIEAVQIDIKVFK